METYERSSWLAEGSEKGLNDLVQEDEGLYTALVCVNLNLRRNNNKSRAKGFKAESEKHKRVAVSTRCEETKIQ
jgi:hypothetical protein